MSQTITLRKMSEDEYAQWKEWSISDYTESLLESGQCSESNAKAQAEADFSYLTNGLSTQNHYFNVAENIDGVPVGSIWYETENSECTFIADFVIYDKYRRMGYGYAVLTELENILKLIGIPSVKLHVFSHNKPAVELYKKFGFTIVEDEDNDKDGSSMYMGKNL